MMRVAAIVAFLASMVSLLPGQGMIPVPSGRKTATFPFTNGSGDNVLVNFSWKTEKLGDPVYETIIECTNVCMGRLHAKHSDCDLKCDRKCDATSVGAKPHHALVSPSLKPTLTKIDGTPQPSIDETIEGAMRGLNLPIGRIYSEDVLDGVEASVKTDDQGGRLGKVAYYEQDHFNEDPCSVRQLKMAAQYYVVTLDYEIRTRIRRNGVVSIGQGPQGKFIYRLRVPDMDRVQFGEPLDKCLCEPYKDKPREIGQLPGFKPEGDDAFVVLDGKKWTITGAQFAEMFTGVSVNDMNTAVLETSMPTSGWAYLPAGYELHSVDGKGQNVQIQTPIILGMPPAYYASLEDFPLLFEPKNIRVLCLEINKPEPNPSLAYRLVPPADSRLTKLAAFSGKQSIRGPWDQMRLWIATDYAPYEKIAKTLIPSPGPGTYVREMWRAATLGAISPFDKRVADMMNPAHLLAKSYHPEAVRWYLGSKLQLDPDSVFRWLEGSSPTIAAIFDRGMPKEDAELVGLFAAELAKTGSEKASLAALRLIGATVPEAHRTAVKETRGAHEAMVSIGRSKDAASVSALLDWLLIARPTYAPLIAANLDPTLPAELRTKADSILGSPLAGAEKAP